MPQYGYLDNNIYQGAGSAAGQMGDAFTRAIVGTQQLRYQQAQMQQQQAMEAARLEMERQKLLAEVPKIRAETEQYRAGADLDKQKASSAKEQLMAGQLANQAMQARQMVMNPSQGGQFQMSPQLAAALPSGQYSQDDLAQKLQGLITGIGAQTSLLAPPSAMSNLAAGMYSQTSPQALQQVAVGFPPNPPRQYLTPEQETDLRLAIPIIQGLARAERDPLSLSAPQGDTQGAIDLATQVRQAMFGGGGTNAPSLTPRSTSTPRQQVSIPKVGEIRKGYRFKGGDPSQQTSWEAAQ